MKITSYAHVFAMAEVVGLVNTSLILPYAAPATPQNNVNLIMLVDRMWPLLPLRSTSCAGDLPPGHIPKEDELDPSSPGTAGPSINRSGLL